MTRLYTCPHCNKRLDLSEIHNAVLDLDGPPEWWCARCKQAAPREAWGDSNDGIPASCYYLYAGPGKHEPFKHKLTRGLVRNKTFAGAFVSRAKIHVPMPDDPDVGSGVDYRTVGLYHRGERYSLLGRYFTPSGGQATKVALLLSGSGGTAHGYLSKVARRYCKRLNTAVLLVDYRGFGSSDRKSPSEQGLFVDATMMYSYLTDGVEMGGLGWKPGEVVVHGFSLGTGVAAELAAKKRHIGGLVLQCPFTSAAAMAGEVAKAPGRWATRLGTELDVIGKVPGIERPILLLIANQDDMKEHGEQISNEAVWRKQPNITVGFYDGEHEEPQNAFKDGNTKYKVEVVVDPQTSRVTCHETTQLAQKGDEMIAKRHLQLNSRNLKTHAGTSGCIGVISKWLGTF